MTIFEHAQNLSNRLRPAVLTRFLSERHWDERIRRVPGRLLDAVLQAPDTLRVEGPRGRRELVDWWRAAPARVRDAALDRVDRFGELLIRTGVDLGRRAILVACVVGGLILVGMTLVADTLLLGTHVVLGLLLLARRRVARPILHTAARAARWVRLELRQIGLTLLHLPLLWKVMTCAIVLAPFVISLELRTGIFESHLLSALASRLEWTVGSGPSPSIVYPQSGPFDIERGYSRIPEFVRRLTGRGYRIGEQARFSGTLAMLARAGLTPPWREPPSDGLIIRDASGDTLFRGTSSHDLVTSYDELPPLVVQTLLYIENRGLISDPEPTSNPAVDWARFVKATGLWAGRRIGLPLPVEGGSTLAVQLEKLRHFDGGRTRSPADKLRQIAAASLRAYRLGPDTRTARREIILGYVNSAPLAATPGHGEVRGLGEGLRYWFDRDPHGTLHAIADPASIEQQAHAYHAVIALICALRAPSRYLIEDPDALEKRVDFYVDRLEENGVLPAALASAVRSSPLALEPAERAVRRFRSDKSANAIRGEVANLLGVRDRYALDRLDVDVESTVDATLERRAQDLFRVLADRDSVAAKGLMGEHLLPTGDPAGITYSLLLLESTPAGYRVCAHVDNRNQPFDPILGMKMDLGSTAKLRTLAHYLEVMETLHQQLGAVGPDSLHALERTADPLTRWAAATLDTTPAPPLEDFLSRSLDRVYSASPYEAFFTGGGLHSFHNFEPEDNGRRLTIREALVRSVNLVFVRLMRDLERYHEARLPYSAENVLADLDHPERLRLLGLAEAEESRQILYRAWSRWRGTPGDSMTARILHPETATAFRAAVLYQAWSGDTSAVGTAAWVQRHLPRVPAEEAIADARKVTERRFSLLDQAYVMHLHPLELWCAGQIARTPNIGWSALWAASAAPRSVAMSWLMNPEHRRAQDLRLRVQIEKEAFDRMTPEWRRLGFPFQRLVPSYATAIGASGDRPIALANLMGTILDDGIHRPSTGILSLRIAAGTPYQTEFEPGPAPEQRVMSAVVARTLRSVLAEVPQRGTARRLNGVFVAPDGTPIPIAGKTGSGDNRQDQFARGGRLIASRATSRTAVFAFDLGDRHFGVLTALVPGAAAGSYSFTSALPVQVMSMLAPALMEHLDESDDASMAAHHAPKPRPEPALAAVPGAPDDSSPAARAALRLEEERGAARDSQRGVPPDTGGGARAAGDSSRAHRAPRVVRDSRSRRPAAARRRAGQRPAPELVGLPAAPSGTNVTTE